MFKCEYCRSKLKTAHKLSLHVQKFHSTASDRGESPDVIVLKFDSQQAFNDWKNKEEISSLSRYVQHRGATMNKDKTVSTKKYYCHRSGVFVSQNTGKRALKLTGSVKIDQRCPSFIQAVTKDKIIHVKYYKTHKGHENDVQYLPIPNFVQESIAGKINSGVPPNIILQQLRADFGHNVEQINYITRKYVYNVAAKFGLLHQYRLNEDANIKQYPHYIHEVIFNMSKNKNEITQGDVCNSSELDEITQSNNTTSKNDVCNPSETDVITQDDICYSFKAHDSTQDNVCNSLETDDISQDENEISQGKNIISQGDVCNPIETGEFIQSENTISLGENATQDNTCNSVETDNIYMKLPAIKQLTETSNKIKDFYKLFMSVAGTLNDQQFRKINSSLDEGLNVLLKQKKIILEDKKLKLLCKQEYNILKDIENSNSRTSLPSCYCFTPQKTRGNSFR